MTLLFMDSFDHYTIPGDVSKKYESVNISAMTSLNPARTNIGVRFGGGQCYLAKTVGQITGYLMCGFGYFGATGIAAQSIVSFNDRLYPCISIFRNADSTVSIYRRSGTSAKALLGTGVPALLSLNAWHYVEVKAIKSTAAGEVYVYVDGVEAIHLTAVNTDGASDQGPYTAVCLGGEAALNNYGGTNVPGNKDYDDFYILDDTGGDNNDLLGTCNIYCIYPNADTAPNEWTPSAGVDHFAMVDEHDHDDDTTHLEVTDADAAEVFGLEDSPVAIGSVAGIQVNTSVRKSSPGGATYKHQLRQGSTTAEGEEVGFPSGSVYAYNSEPFDKDPTDNVDWTFARVNSLEAGVKRNA